MQKGRKIGTFPERELCNKSCWVVSTNIKENGDGNYKHLPARKRQRKDQFPALLATKALTPLEYLKENVQIISARKMLYRCIFDRFKIDTDEDNDYGSQVSGKSLPSCFDLLMGKPLTTKQSLDFKNSVGWHETDLLEFRTCCGVFALCERLLAPVFCPRLPDRNSDPCHEIEKADFEILGKKLNGRQVDEELKNILQSINNS